MNFKQELGAPNKWLRNIRRRTNMNGIDINKLREERRPLWMSGYDSENFADMLGGGGDVWQDRLHPEWHRDYGEETQEPGE
jgi:hypothetical protein